MIQPDLFMSPFLNTLTGPQRKARGIKRVSENNAIFLVSCRAKARELFSANGFVNPDDIREWADGIGLKPSHKNAWGAIFNRAEWETCGMVHSRIPTNNGRRVFLWKLKVKI